MKIKREFQIRLLNSNLNILKLPLPSPLTFRLKSSSKYLEVDYTLPLLRSKSDTMTLYSHGVCSFSSLYLLQSTDECVYKISTVFKFSSKFPDREESKTSLQFRKVESREEVEHRKRNINYKIKMIDQESIISNNITYNNNKYSITSNSITSNNIISNSIISNNIISNSIISDKIERCIRNRVVVNYSDLLILFPGQSEEIKMSLQKMTFYHKGRYILKDKFYDKPLQKIRQEIISNNLNHISNLILSNSDLFEDGVLKGYYEDDCLDYKNISLLNLLREKLVFSLRDIKDISGLEMEDIYKFIKENEIVEIFSNLYCVEMSREIEGVSRLAEKETVKKSEVSEIVRNEKYKVEEFYFIFEKIFHLKRGTFMRK